MGKKSKPASPPAQVDPNESMGEYLFGQGFKSDYQGITDPALQDRLIESEKKYRPQYAALEMQDIATAARGGYGQPGLFDLLEEQSQRAGGLQRSEAEKQRASDVGALKEYAPQVVDAYRQADPYSTGLADMASDKASEDLGLASKGKEMMGAEVQDAGQAEQKLLESGAKLSDLSPTEQEAVLRKSGIELSSLSPTEKEALLNKRGTEFLESTGELTALEKRRVEQQARAGSLGRGREMDQSGLYDEVQSRMAEELNKRDREIALGSGLFGQGESMRNQRVGLGASLLGQEAGMSQSRMGLGGQFLGAGESLAAQRRAEQMQKQQFGAGLIGQEAAIGSQRLGQAFGMQRGMAGDVGMTLLGRPTQSIGLGGQVLGQSQGLAA